MGFLNLELGTPRGQVTGRVGVAGSGEEAVEGDFHGGDTSAVAVVLDSLGRALRRSRRVHLQTLV